MKINGPTFRESVCKTAAVSSAFYKDFYIIIYAINAKKDYYSLLTLLISKYNQMPFSYNR